MLNFKKRSTKELVQGGTVDTPSEPKKRFNGFGSKQDRVNKPESRFSFRTMMRTRIFWGSICLIIGLLVPIIGVPMFKNHVVETVDVVQFRTNLKAGSQITAEMLNTVELSAYHLPQGAIIDTRSIIDQYLLVDAVAGDYVTAARLSATHPGSDLTLVDLPEGKMALSIPLPDLSQSVSSKLRGGDIIQIFAVEHNSENPTASILDELRYVEVLTATRQDGTDVGAKKDLSEGSSNAETGNSTLTTVTVLVNEQQAACLTGLSQNSTLYAALVIRGNDEKKAAALATQEALFASPESPESEPTVPPPDEMPEAMPTDTTQENTITESEEGT